MTTGVASFFLMFGREMRSKLPELRREAPITNEEICDRDWARKLTQKYCVDTKRHAVESQVDRIDSWRSSIIKKHQNKQTVSKLRPQSL